MPITLNKPLSWLKADEEETKMLQDLQGNILKGHGRHHTVHLFLQFDESNQKAARSFVHAIAHELPSALSQLKAASDYKLKKTDGGIFHAFFLSASGYTALGRADAIPTPGKVDVFPNPDVFRSGMKASSPSLADPPVETWNATFRHELHAMLLMADNSPEKLATRRAAIERQIGATGKAVKLLGVEEGHALFNDDKHGIEHFGYVDGRSQPLMLIEDIEEERLKHGGIDQWDPSIELGQVLVRCPASKESHSHGSYFVFRKLEQNVRGFKKDEKRLANHLRLGAGIDDPEKADEAREVAGAFVVGRFEHGTPVALSDEPQTFSGEEVPNNFNFKADPHGMKCPFAGHIRKSNPRGESEDPAKLGAPKGSEIRHLMARRGITYGKRAVDPNKPDLSFEEMPTGDVGLLFMAYQSSLANQFEFTQRSWVNNPGFVADSTGIDPIIGQSVAPNGTRWPSSWGQPMNPAPFDFSRWVTLQGGEYFFAPSLSGLKAL